MKSYLFIVLALTLSSTSAFAFGSKPLPVPKPDPAPGPSLEKTCPAPGSVQAVDVSEQINQKFLDAMKQLKVSTVIRYYDQVNETLPGKTLRQSEVDLLARNGFDLMVVFQHNNNSIASFTSARGTSDATRSLQLAGAYKQQKGSAIYFGVDGSWTATADLNSIKTYFSKAGPLVRGAGYKIGAYGSGLTCSTLLGEGLVDYCWLANATGWAGYTSFYNTKSWTMVQKLPADCGGINVDFDVVNAGARDTGSFRP